MVARNRQSLWAASVSDARWVCDSSAVWLGGRNVRFSWCLYLQLKDFQILAGVAPITMESSWPASFRPHFAKLMWKLLLSIEHRGPPFPRKGVGRPVFLLLGPLGRWALVRVAFLWPMNSKRQTQISRGQVILTLLLPCTREDCGLLRKDCQGTFRCLWSPVNFLCLKYS